MSGFGFDFGQDDEENPLMKIISSLGSAGGGFGQEQQVESPTPLMPDNFTQVASSSMDSGLDQPTGSVVSGSKEDLYHRYSQMLQEKPKAIDVMEEYHSRQPKYSEYRPSGMDKFRAAAFGVSEAMNKNSGGAGAKTAVEWRDRPFRNQQLEYEQEGRLVDDKARIADSARNRGLQGIMAQIRQQEAESNNRYRQQDMETRREEQRLTREERTKEKERDFGEKVRATKERETDRDFDRADRTRNYGETARHNRAMELKSTGLGGEDKLSPFQKIGLKKYETATSPLDPKNRFENAIAQNPGLRDLFEDRSDAETMSERAQLVPRSDLTPSERDRLRAALEDNRLLDALNFGGK